MTIKTKRPKFIITGFFFSTIMMIVFLSVLIFWIYPKVRDISIEKENVNKKIDDIESIKKKWLTYQEFKELKQSYESSVYLDGLFKIVDKNFFESNFVNPKQWEDYNSFITKKEIDVDNEQKNEKFVEIQESYKSILPTYVEENNENDEWVMTDLKFVTYIESILYTFNLEMANKNITVWNLNILPEYNDNNESSLDTSIYYIPYTFDLTWKKKDILDFLYFLENVWSIIINDSWEIEIIEDNYINKKLIWYEDKNIFKNQIIDIEDIRMSEYIDSGNGPSWKDSLIEYLKQTQWNERLNVYLKVRFYVKGVPNYKIQEWIDNLSSRHSAIIEDLSKQKNSKDIKSIDKLKIEKALTYLWELNTTIKEIKKEKKDLNKAYKKVIEVNKLLDVLEKTTKSESNNLNVNE